MLEAVPLIAVTTFFISIFLYAYANLQLEEIRGNWDERRCETLVMLLANMVPKDPDIDPSTFAINNFNFCMGKMIDSSLSIMLQPMMKSFSVQIDATKPISKAMSNLKTSAFSLLAPFLSVFGGLWKKLKLVSFEAIRVYYNINTAMDRVFGIAAASLFAGMGVFSGIKSAMGFIIQVIIAILIILCILVIFLFFVMGPILPIIITMIGILSATVYQANVSGMTESFCVGPDTLVKMDNGWKKVSEIQPGDPLDDGVVEGVLKVAPPALGSCVSINNVIISKSHLVYCDGWISAGDHPNAKPIDTAENLYCLNTSTRMWEVKSIGSQMSLRLRDWEEIPDNEQFDFAWESLISGILNGSDKTQPLRSAVGRGLLGPLTFVWKDRIGTITPITQIKIGDSVADARGLTKVIGIYSDTGEVPESGPNDSVWNYENVGGKPLSTFGEPFSSFLSKKIWTHPKQVGRRPLATFGKVLKSAAKTMGGCHLVTESGTFKIGFGCETMLVRDFTEVGANRIHETYPFIKSII